MTIEGQVRNEGAALRGLVYSSDESLNRLLLPPFGDLSMEASVCETPEAAATAIQQNRFDCAVIDCEKALMPADIACAFSQSEANRECVIAAVVGKNSAGTMAPAQMTLCRPWSQIHAFRSLLPLYGEALQRRRASFRADLHLAATLSVKGVPGPVTVINIGGNGMQLQMRERIAHGERVSGNLTLPSHGNPVIDLSGEIVWVSENGTTGGVRFVGMCSRSERALKRWLAAEFDQVRGVAA